MLSGSTAGLLGCMMPERERPSERQMQHLGLLLVPEPNWRDRISSWLLPVYHIVTPEDVERIGYWRRFYALPSHQTGRWLPVRVRVRHPRMVSRRFDRWGGDLRKAARALIHKDTRNG